MIEEIKIANGYCFLGFSISEAWTAWTSTPANNKIIPDKYERLFMLDKFGSHLGETFPSTTVATAVSAAVSSSKPNGFFIIIQTIPRMITITPGKTVPTRKPQLVTFERSFVPPKAIKVAIQ